MIDLYKANGMPKIPTFSLSQTRIHISLPLSENAFIIIIIITSYHHRLPGGYRLQPVQYSRVIVVVDKVL